MVRREGRRVILEPADEWPDEFRACLGAWLEDIPRPVQRPVRDGTESTGVTLRYMLDTDTVSGGLRGQGAVATHILAHRPSQLCISSITLAELRFGADAKGSRKLHGLIDTFVASVAVMPFDRVAADRFGPVANALAKRGERIGTFDTLIAAHALSLSLTFVTNNSRHFQRVPGLKTANWV